MTEAMTAKRGPGRPRKNPLQVEAEAAAWVETPEEAPAEEIKPQGHYDRKAASSGAMIYQVVSHTRDAIRVLGPRGSVVAMLYRRSPIPGTNGQVMDHPFAEVAARELAELLNRKAEALR